MRAWIISLVAALLAAGQLPAVPGAGKAVREGAEQAMARLGREGTEEVSNQLVRRIDKAVLRHGEESRSLFRSLGADSIEMAGRYGEDGIRLMSRYGSDGLAVLARSGDEVIPLVHRYGDEVVETAIRHPGVGEKLVAEFGADGIRLARRLDTNGAIAVLRSGSRSGASASSLTGRAVRFAGEHPGAVAVGAGAALLVTKPDWFESLAGVAGRGAGNAVRSILEGMFGKEAARWAAWALVAMGLGAVTLIYGLPRWSLGYARRRR